MRRLAVSTVFIVAALRAQSAHAGRTHFAWLYGSDVIPERGVEVENWIAEENKKGDAKADETSFWWGPVMALSQHVEFAISGEAADGTEGVSFTRWGADVRYRPQSPDPIDAGPFATLFRIGAKRLIHERDGVRGEADAVASYTAGLAIISVDLGAVYEHVPMNDELEFRPSAGVSFRVVQDFRLGVETYSELIAKGDGTSWLVVGPTASLTHGRFWGAATLGIGVFGIRDAPRLTFGVAL
ncbi:MAG TPA: hypothetical protein VLB44_18875 [Kofleriaceae bacterium]|nr:hypothetical protein [Kofleriaceae bacterium]